MIRVWNMLRGGDTVADVVQFPDGQTITKWRGKYTSLTVWQTWADAAAVHTHSGQDEGRTTFRIRAELADAGYDDEEYLVMP